MRQNIKKIALSLALVLMVITLTACGGGGARAVPNENRIQEDLAESGLSVIPTSQTIDSVEILDYDTDNDAGVHHVTVLIHSHDEEVAYIKYATLAYQRNADREWVLSSVWADRENLWSSSPLVGAPVAVIEAAIHGLQVTIDGDEWRLDEDSIENVTVHSQNTQLENRRDTVVVTVELGSAALTAQGQVEMEFVFDGGWFRNSYRSYTPFVSEYRPHAVFELSNDQLLDEVVRGDAGILREMMFHNGREGQTIGLSRDEISNLTIDGYASSNKGTTRVYDYSFTLTRGIVVFQVEAQAFYQFDSMSGWTLERFDFTPNVSAVHLEGT